MQIVETIKAHKGLAAGVALGAIVLVLALRASSGGSVQTYATGDVATGDAVTAAQLQSQHDIAIAGINAQASGAHDAAALSVAQLDYDYKNNAASIGGNIAMAQINASLQALTNHDTLSAQVANTASNNQVQTTAITTKAATDQMGLLTGVISSQINANASVANNAINAANSHCNGFWDCVL